MRHLSLKLSTSCPSSVTRYITKSKNKMKFSNITIELYHTGVAALRRATIEAELCDDSQQSAARRVSQPSAAGQVSQPSAARQVRQQRHVLRRAAAALEAEALVRAGRGRRVEVEARLRRRRHQRRVLFLQSTFTRLTLSTHKSLLEQE